MGTDLRDGVSFELQACAVCGVAVRELSILFFVGETLEVVVVYIYMSPLW